MWCSLLCENICLRKKSTNKPSKTVIFKNISIFKFVEYRDVGFNLLLTSSTSKNNSSPQKCHTYFLKIYFCVWCAHLLTVAFRSQKRGVRIPETGVTRGWGALGLGARNGTPVHHKSSRHSTSEPSHQPLYFLF